MTQSAYLMSSMIRLEKNAFVWGLLLLGWCNPHTEVSTDELVMSGAQMTQGKCHQDLWY